MVFNPVEPGGSFVLTLRDACRNDQAEAVKQLLVERQEALHMMTPWGTWLHVASGAGALCVVRLLLSLGSDPNVRGGAFNGNALNEAAPGGHVDVMSELFEAGAVLDTSEPDRNPLFGAVYAGKVEAVRWLVERGIDHRVVYSGKHMTNMDALAFAVERGQSEIASYLLRARYTT